jgi:hypothetical protein
MMKALIDGDVLCYSVGSATDDEGKPLSWPLTFARLKGKIEQIVRDSGADEFAVYVTGKGNFRHTEATIKPYKGNRNEPKPHHYQRVRDYFSKAQDIEVVWCEGYEADDGMSIDQCENIEPTIICSIDKDLDMVLGWHYQWVVGDRKPRPPYFVDYIDGMRWFFKQLLMGDTTDNILGLYNVGKKSTLVTKLDTMENVQEMYDHVQRYYEKYFGSYWRMFLNENARLLWMLEQEDDDVRDSLDVLECNRQKKLEEQF